MLSVEVVQDLPTGVAAEEILEQWIGLADENAALFSGQAILEAERGDIEAALYASSAAEFAIVIKTELAAFLIKVRAREP